MVMITVMITIMSLSLLVGPPQELPHDVQDPGDVPLDVGIRDHALDQPVRLLSRARLMSVLKCRSPIVCSNYVSFKLKVLLKL